MHACRRSLALTVLVLLVVLGCSDDSASNTGPVGAGGTAAAAAGSGGSATGAAGGGAAGQAATAAGRSGGAGSSVTGAAGTSTTPAAAGSSAAGSSAAAGGGAAGMAAATAGTAAGGAAGASGMMGAAGGTGGMPATGGDCDRKCLLAIMQTYLDALVAKDPTKFKSAATVRATENGVEIKLGEGLFKTATALVPDERLDFADPMLGNVTSQLVVNEGTAPVLYMVRLKVANMEVTEIESMAVRRQGAANGFFNPMNMKPEPVFLQEVEPAKRKSRAELEMITQLYLDYLEGKKNGMQVPFDAGCKRYENGQVTASGLSSFNAQRWSFQLTRRILVIDEEAQITWGMFPFMQSARALVVGEAFKIIDGKIMMIQAVMANQPTDAWK